MRPIHASPFLYYLVESLWFINFYWSLVNLLPLFPLDGGQLFRLGMVRVVKPARKAERVVHIVGISIAGIGLVYAIIIKSILLGILSAALTSAAGFLVLAFARFRPVAELGVFVALGVVIILVTSAARTALHETLPSAFVARPNPDRRPDCLNCRNRRF